jgi:hypothetical protein
MTIENMLERIANALETIAVSGAKEAAPVKLTMSAGTQEAPMAPTPEPAKRGPGRPPKAKAAPTPEPAPEPVVETPFDDGPEPVAPTREDVRAALIAYQKRHSPEQARSILKKVGGVDTLSTLPEEKFALVIEAAK